TALGERGKRVLIVDLDSSTSQAVGVVVVLLLVFLLVPPEYRGSFKNFLLPWLPSVIAVSLLSFIHGFLFGQPMFGTLTVCMLAIPVTYALNTIGVGPIVWMRLAGGIGVPIVDLGLVSFTLMFIRQRWF
ncbi:MAG: hypothetical protein AAGJ83_11480, partial [Planctomycetota bacterium]